MTEVTKNIPVYSEVKSVEIEYSCILKSSKDDLNSPYFYIFQEDFDVKCYLQTSIKCLQYSVNIDEFKFKLFFIGKKEFSQYGIKVLDVTMWFNNSSHGCNVFLEERKKWESTFHKINDHVTLNSKITVHLKISYRQKVNSQLSGFSYNFSNLLYSQDFADFKIKVENKIFNVHKCILSVRSDVLKKMISTEMLEKKNNEIDFSLWDHAVVEEVLTYIYTNKCRIVRKPDELFKLAHFLQLEELQLQCYEYMINNIHLKSVIPILKLAHCKQYNLLKLEKAAYTFFSEHEASLVLSKEVQDWLCADIQAQNIYFILKIASTYNLSDLRCKVLKFIRINYKAVFEIKKNKEFLNSNPELMFDILQSSLNFYSTKSNEENDIKEDK